MSKQLLAIAVVSLATIGCGDGQLLSPRAQWGKDFTDRSPATDKCPGGTLSQLRTRMFVSGPQELAKFDHAIPLAVRSRLSRDDTLHEFQFRTDLAGGGFWGFSGYLVTRDDCVVDVRITGYDN